MSWSIQFIGKPENIAKALEDYSGKLSGQSKVEYDSALPHLVGLVKENFGENPPLLKLEASGHGSVVNGEQKQRNLTVNLLSFYGNFV
jgi:hypothetical protein